MASDNNFFTYIYLFLPLDGVQGGDVYDIRARARVFRIIILYIYIYNGIYVTRRRCTMGRRRSFCCGRARFYCNTRRVGSVSGSTGMYSDVIISFFATLEICEIYDGFYPCRRVLIGMGLLPSVNYKKKK